jgi:4-carboxymuconolactone decarboxylase
MTEIPSAPNKPTSEALAVWATAVEAALQDINRIAKGGQSNPAGRDNGVTQDELIETIRHLAFYAGWPSAVTAISVAKEVFQKK